jgi:hypothetical protein
VLREKFIAMSTYIKKTKPSQISNLIIYLKLLKNKNKSNPAPADREK